MLTEQRDTGKGQQYDVANDRQHDERRERAERDQARPHEEARASRSARAPQAEAVRNEPRRRHEDQCSRDDAGGAERQVGQDADRDVAVQQQEKNAHARHGD